MPCCAMPCSAVPCRTGVTCVGHPGVFQRMGSSRLLSSGGRAASLCFSGNTQW